MSTPQTSTGGGHAPAITAYAVSDTTGWALEPAPARRAWMDETDGFAYRCLPLNVANQAGWIVRSPAGFLATWRGGRAMDATTIRLDPGAEHLTDRIMSHFGWGIITFSIPWLFRTSEGLCLLVRGPTNSVKHGAAPLDGIVETDWAVATFTMNWKLTEPNCEVRFERGEPICMLCPYPVALLERIEASERRIDEDPALASEYRAWADSRTAFNRDAGRRAEDWQKDYMRGVTPTGAPAREHRSRLDLPRFSGGASGRDADGKG